MICSKNHSTSTGHAPRAHAERAMGATNTGWVAGHTATGDDYNSFFVDGDEPSRPRPSRREQTDDAGKPGTSQPEQREAEDESLPDPYLTPLSHEAALETHKKTVTAVAFDKSGARVVTGALDGWLHFHDFVGMRRDMKAFRKLQPAEGHQTVALSWSPTSDSLMVVSTGSQATFLDRDGRALGECARGDMYIRDPRQTKGHTAGLTGGQWHPADKESCVTSSQDGTIRLWDTAKVVQKAVMKPTASKPGRTAITSCCYNAEGTVIAAGISDGTIQLWSSSGHPKHGTSSLPSATLQKRKWTYVSRPGQLMRGAHAPGTEMTSLAFAQDGCTLVSRGDDNTMKVWDIRSFKKPVKVFEDLPCMYSMTRCCFSPDQQLILTCVSSNKEGKGGGLAFFEKSSLERVRFVPYPKSVVCVHWHDKINQIVVGMGDRHGGDAKMLYNPEVSTKGAMLCAERNLKSKDPLGLQAKQVIYNPHALPMYKDTWSNKRYLEEGQGASARPSAKAHRPDPGESILGRGRGGKLGLSEKSLALQQHVIKKVNAWEDPREELLKQPRGGLIGHLYNRAYAKTQPVRILAEEEEPDEGEGTKGRKIDGRTGLYEDED